MPDLLPLLPRPLYEEIVRGRWLPVVGSGLSRNAIVPSGSPPPDWNGLADDLRPDLSDPGDGTDALDVISTYAHEHGRTTLVERVGRSIRVADALPAAVHRSLCRLPLDAAVTTNFDFLLERAFEGVGKPCHPVTDEPQLSIRNPYPGPVLYKIHGDMHRPDRLVLTEEDFDRYLLANPLFATVIASMVAQRSTVLVGYSLSDPDLRQVLALVRDRLGVGARAMYALEVDPPSSTVARFARRHVKVVALPGDRSNPAPTLQQLFDEIFVDLPRAASTRLIPRSHGSAMALRLYGSSCFLAVPFAYQAEYEEWVAPAAAQRGVSIVRLEDFTAPGEPISAKLDAVIATVGCAIVDIGSVNTMFELGVILNRLPAERIFVVLARGEPHPGELRNMQFYIRPETHTQWSTFSEDIAEAIARVLGVIDANRVRRSNVIGEVMVTAAEFESVVGDRLALAPRSRSVSKMADEAARLELISLEERLVLGRFADVRNSLAHGRPIDISAEELRATIDDVTEITDRIRIEGR